MAKKEGVKFKDLKKIFGVRIDHHFGDGAGLTLDELDVNYQVRVLEDDFRALTNKKIKNKIVKIIQEAYDTIKTLKRSLTTEGGDSLTITISTDSSGPLYHLEGDGGTYFTPVVVVQNPNVFITKADEEEIDTQVHGIRLEVAEVLHDSAADIRVFLDEQGLPADVLEMLITDV